MLQRQIVSFEQKEVGTVSLGTPLCMLLYAALPLLQPNDQLLPHSSAHEPLNQNTRQTSCAIVTLHKAPPQARHVTAGAGPSGYQCTASLW